MSNQLTNEPWLDSWDKIGNRNLWIREAYDPPFTKKMLEKCDTVESLQEKLSHTGWCLGQGFCYQNLCFINQMEGGDEWLTIKDDYPFETITFADFIKRGVFPVLIERLLRASKEDCIKLKY
jgi:hypothetical protein